MVFQKCTCPCKLYEPAKRYSRNNRVFGSVSQKSAFVFLLVGGVMAWTFFGKDLFNQLKEISA